MAMNPKESLDTMLGYLGFAFDIEEFPDDQGVTLQVYTHESRYLIGRNGEVLDNLQILLNKLCQAQDKNAPKVHLDVEHWRSMRDDKLAQKVRNLAESVRRTGRPVVLDPMNAYDRRIVHTVFKDDRDVVSESPHTDAHLKRITLKRRGK
jgi:spoIIIJ-associated protein